MIEHPTPIQRLTRLEQAVDCANCPPIYVKRDDPMGIGGVGNKLRKLEFLIGEALDQGCDTFIATGARQSNYARLSAAAAARAGLACELVLTDTVARDDEAYRRGKTATPRASTVRCATRCGAARLSTAPPKPKC